MNCTEAIYSDSVLDYIVRSYLREEVLMERYDPICFQRIDGEQAIVYKESEDINNGQIRQFGYTAVPKCYALMDQSALEDMGVLRLRRQPGYDLYGQGILIGFVDTGERVIIMSS